MVILGQYCDCQYIYSFCYCSRSKFFSINNFSHNNNFFIQVLAAIYKKSNDLEHFERKEMLPEEQKTAMNFLTVWDFEGYLKYSPLFYG